MLFAISFLMVLISSYFISCSFAEKNEQNKNYGPTPFLYLLLTIFAQVIITFEALSIFKAINETNVIILNILFLISSIILWNKKHKPIYIPALKTNFIKIFKALKRDKILMIMGFGFVFLIISAIILAIIMPVFGGDALAYHLNRASYWLHQGSLNHFTIADDRNIVMPINSEILYLWNLLFFKNDYGLYFISFFGYIGAIFSIYNILEYFKFSQRKILWTIFIVSSFASVIAEISSSETDILLAGLVLSSITLFLYSLKKINYTMLFFASLAYAIAIGTKTPAIIAFPAVFLALSYFSYQEHKKDFHKPLIIFLALLFLNFLIFASYNYVLNFIDFGNPLGSESARAIHGFRGGIKAFVANFIKYIFMLFDFSGFRYSEYVGEHILKARETILTFLNIPMDLGVEIPDNNTINNRLLNAKVGTGILGFLLFIPSLITSIIMGIIKNNNKKMQAITALAIMFLINLICLSFSIAYMVFSVRFVTFLVVISSPILVISYFKRTNLIKLLVLFFVMSYFMIISLNLAGRGFKDIFHILMLSKTYQQAREQMRCSIYTGFTGKTPLCYIKEYITYLPKNSNIAFFPEALDRTYYIDMLNSHGYKITTLLAELAPDYKYDNYDYIITTDEILISTVIKKQKNNINSNLLNYYNPNSNYGCAYELHNKGFYSETNTEGKIMDSQCYIKPEFFKEKGFTVKQIINFKSDDACHKSYVIIYEKPNKK